MDNTRYKEGVEDELFRIVKNLIKIWVFNNDIIKICEISYLVEEVDVVNFKCTFLNSDSDEEFSKECNCYCSDCPSFNRCNFCIHTLECFKKHTDGRCQFSNLVIRELLNQEKTSYFYRDEFDG